MGTFAHYHAPIMERSTHTVTVVGASLGDRGKLVRAFAHKGTEVQLRRLGSGAHSRGIGVWVRCVRFWGLWKTWAHIGFVVPDRAEPWAPEMDSGSIRVVKAWVHSNYAPLEEELPKVSVRVVVESQSTTPAPLSS
jgi:hypothetical protein